MLLNKLSVKPVISVNDLLDSFHESTPLDFQKILQLDFELNINYQNQKISPIIHLAKSENAENISNLFKEVYKGTYPYKQMEDAQEVENMIRSPNFHWFLFKVSSNEAIGCFGVQLELEKKRGLLFGFVLKKKYQKIVDTLKTFVGCLLFVCNKYKDKILLWYGEIRTNDTSPQFITSSYGLKPIAFLPNKDIFLNKIESEVLHVIYTEEALHKYRSKEKPKIIRQILGSYVYSNNRFRLGSPKVANPKLNYNKKKLANIKKGIIKRTEKDKYGNKIITFSIKNTTSYFKFLYNSYIQSFEKTKYKVKYSEELYTFLQEVKYLMKKLDIRYFECYVSPYNCIQQKIFFDAGLKPRGYIFSWDYNKKKKVFEDRVVFNLFKGNIDVNIKLIPETIELLQNLKISFS